MKYRVVAAGFLSGLIVAGPFAGAAMAAGSNHSIEGANKANGGVSVSDNIRTMTAKTKLTASFATLPELGLVFGTQSTSGAYWGQNTWGKNETGVTRDVSSGSHNKGSRFVNFFRLTAPCNSWFGCAPYSFSGTEKY